MSISIARWHASIGLFYGQVSGHLSIKLEYQEYPANAGVPQGSILNTTLFL